jgi:hypothetical protein
MDTLKGRFTVPENSHMPDGDVDRATAVVERVLDRFVDRVCVVGVLRGRQVLWWLRDVIDFLGS